MSSKHRSDNREPEARQPTKDQNQPQATTPNTPLVFCLPVKVPLFGHSWPRTRSTKRTEGGRGNKRQNKPTPQRTNRPKQQQKPQTPVTPHTHPSPRGRSARNQLVHGPEWLQNECRKRIRCRPGQERGGQGQPTPNQPPATTKPQQNSNPNRKGETGGSALASLHQAIAVERTILSSHIRSNKLKRKRIKCRPLREGRGRGTPTQPQTNRQQTPTTNQGGR